MRLKPNMYQLENASAPALNGIFATYRDMSAKILGVNISEIFYNTCEVFDRAGKLILTGSNIGVGLDYIIHSLFSHSNKTISMDTCESVGGIATMVFSGTELHGYKDQFTLTFSINK